VPVDKRKNFKQINLFINKANNLITKAVVTDKQGNITEISFGNATFNAVIPDSQFVFDASKHPGVEVVNL
jgi:outer membrane lipoprotein-sorting protein